MSNEVIFTERVNGVAYVTVYDNAERGRGSFLPRYTIQKIMRLPNGRTAIKYRRMHKRPSVLAYARKWLAGRAITNPTPEGLAA